MSRKGNDWDNVVAEIFFTFLISILIHRDKLITEKQVNVELIEDIEIWYNRKRRHSDLNYAIIEELTIKLITKM